MKYKRRQDTVAIIGSHPGRRDEYDFERDDCDVWVFNEAVKTETNSGFAPADKVSAVFQLHKPVIWKNPNNRNDKNHFEFLQNTDIPVFMIEEYEEVPSSVKYPLDEIREKIGDKLLTSSVAEGLALAAYLGYKRVEIYGVEMETNTEWSTQRPGVCFWAGYLRGMGVEVDEHWNIYNTPVYGFEGDIILPYHLFADKIEELTPDCDRLKGLYEKQHKIVSKALEQCVLTGSMEEGKRFSDNIITLVQMGQEFGRLDGMRQENERYKKKADAMIEATGSHIFSRQEFEGSLIAHGKGAQESSNSAQVNGGKFEALFNNMIKTSSKKNRARRMVKAAPVLEEYVKASVRAAMYTGAAETNRALMHELDKLINAAGGAKSEAVMLEAAGVK